MCSLSFCRMEVHHGIRNARLQGDYSDYALTEPCPLRSTDDPSGLYRVFSGLKTFQGELWSHGPTKAKAGKTELCANSSIDPIHRVRSTRTRDTARSMYTSSSSIELVHEQQLDRSSRELDRSESRSIPACHAAIDLSRSINPGQMISQPFDLLGANRLDRTTANRIEPKSTPELFRPIFSHCLGYAVFQSFTLLFIVSEGEEIKPLFSQFGEDF
ncbi:unnamed protein product [Microthlaspi erraticum]|uniref:Uncharacterized protein n=1 Tax=Microthlaspi erraticum TaxID=1685480 RepID=A0A6D2JHY9_9BRAS|nr:unnamed protein product [Microthlaspi erraticum]